MTGQLTKVLLAASLVMLAGCEPQIHDPNRWYYDQDIRERVFLQCLEKAPAGPEVTKYNDWAEVVSECSSAAQGASIVGSDCCSSYRRSPEIEK